MTISDKSEYNEHLMYPYENDNGDLAGVTIPIVEPFDTIKQWQALLDGFVGGVKQQNPRENIEGLYAVSLNMGSKPQDLNSLNIERLSYGDVANSVKQSLQEYSFPKRTLGLIALVNENKHQMMTGTLALQGSYSPGTNKMHADRIIASVYDIESGLKLNIALNYENKQIIRLFGKVMLKALDKNFYQNIA